jgi:hypothetical protein
MYFIGPISGNRILLLEIWPGMKVGNKFSWKFKGWFSISVDGIFNIRNKQVYVDEFLAHPGELN